MASYRQSDSLSTMPHNILKRIVFLILLTTLSFAHADGVFEWTSSNFQVLHGSGFKLGATERSTLTVEHVNGWRYGDNFVFIDIVQRDDVGVEVYGEWL